MLTLRILAGPGGFAVVKCPAGLLRPVVVVVLSCKNLTEGEVRMSPRIVWTL